MFDQGPCASVSRLFGQSVGNEVFYFSVASLFCNLRLQDSREPIEALNAKDVLSPRGAVLHFDITRPL